MSEFSTDYHSFRRLHPLTLLYRLIRNLPAIAIPVYLGLIQNQTEEIINFLIFIFIGILIIPGIILTWYYFTFLISEKEIIIKSGIFSRKQRNIPLERVQNINVKQDLIQRILGIARVQIETAGDVAAEGVLEFVKLKDADEINRLIRTYQKKIIEEKENSSDLNNGSNPVTGTNFKSETYNPSESGEVLFEMTSKDLLTYGMIRLRPLFILYGFWAMSFISQFKSLEKLIYGYLDTTLGSFADLPLYYLIPLGIIFLLLSLLISWILDIIWTFAQYYGFRLIKDGNKLFSSYGLISKYSVTIPLRKLQQITISTNPVKKKFNFYTMVLHTAGIGISAKSVPAAVPLAKKEKLEEISAQIYPVEIPNEFKSISKKTVRRAFLRYIFLFVPVIIAGYFAFDLKILFAFILLPGLYYAAFLRWQYRGYSITDRIIFVREGFWNQRLNIIPVEKIQTLQIHETFFQRRLGLASVMIDTASSNSFHDASIPDIDTFTAGAILEELNYAFNTIKKSNTN